MKKEEQLWRQAAKAYVKEYSAELRRDLEAVDKEEALETPRADMRVRSYVLNAKRQTRRWRVFIAAAACLVLVFLLPLLWQGGGVSLLPGTGRVLPLSFTLPGRFSVAKVELDLGKTVYSLEDARGDPVVMTMEELGNTEFFDALTPVTVDGKAAFAGAENGYRLLAFERQGILYVLTCRYDLDTLAGLCRAIPA